jgi:hypothetical protein
VKNGPKVLIATGNDAEGVKLIDDQNAFAAVRYPGENDGRRIGKVEFFT